MRLKHQLHGDDGFGLVEVLVTALIVLILAAGVLATFDAQSHATGLAKARSTALGLAQMDQARLRAMTISDLANVNNDVGTEQVCDKADNECVTYTTTSNADWVRDGTGIESCTQASAGFDYLKITSTVTWPNLNGHLPAKEESFVTPPVGTFGPNQGALAVKIVRADGVTGVPGVAVSLSGTKSYSDVTNSLGCVVWGLLPADGTYTVTANGSDFVDVNGNATVTQAAGVTAQALTTVTIMYDEAASANVSFFSKLGSTGRTFAEKVDRVTVTQPKMAAARIFGAGGSPQSSLTLSPLFPFGAGSPGGPDLIYAGDCPGANPLTQTPPETQLQYLPNLTPGGAATAQLQVPAFDFKVRVAANGSTYGGGSNGAGMRDASGADNVQVKVIQKTLGCPAAAPTMVALDTTGANAARMQDPGAEYGSYTLCVQGLVGGQMRHEQFDGVTLNKLPGTAVTSPASGTAGDGAASTNGVVNLTKADASGDCSAVS